MEPGARSSANAGDADAEMLLRLAEQRFLAGDLAGALRAAREAQARCPRAPFPDLAHAVAAYEVHAAAAMSRASSRNWYAVLSVSTRTSLSSAAVTHEDIKRRYRELCLVLHPDKNPSAAADGAFKLLQEAWNVLSARHPPAPAAAGGAKPPRSAPTPSPARPRPPAPAASAARSSSRYTRRPPPQDAGEASNSRNTPGPPPAPPRAFRSALCVDCDMKFYRGDDEEELCVPCRERQRDPTRDSEDMPSPPRRGSRRFPCPGRCAHCGAGFASSMVSVGMLNLHCAACRKYAKVHVRSPSSAEVW